MAAIPGLKVRDAYNYSSYTTAQANTTIKSGAGVLRRILVTGGTTATITVYDNTTNSGTAILTFTTTNALAVYEVGAAFSTGLTIVTSAALNITFIWA